MTPPRLPRRPRGFTLLELTVTLAVAGVLATLAWGGYGHCLLKARRAEGRAALLQALLQEERQFSADHIYRAFLPDKRELQFTWFSGDSPQHSAYQLGAQACPGEGLDSCVRVTATPAGIHRDEHCGALFADTMGRRGPSADGCW
ncbi:type IV pilin protein [Herbaspirillum sp. WKF16]|jgi:type IV pilus assembly protein PilE|uniref:type IV pilin protein n=1 Tax=Herbaspirillum sp. WKF16 TaxID=3028312 RepID=UPI0023A9FB11|nr:type IV pilin protein [Herbaspirillum sp. WKF16]WDZ95148.1 type IV pilin protein [Herbaspirillum sp. WKF16]